MVTLIYVYFINFDYLLGEPHVFRIKSTIALLSYSNRIFEY